MDNRIRGRFASMADNLTHIAEALGQTVELHRVDEAATAYLRFTRESLAPAQGVIEALTWLRSEGIRTALVTNCAPDVPTAWAASSFAPLFDACAFSCEQGAVKPDAEIYRAALAMLDVVPHEAVFVGGGSDAELSGARVGP